MQISKILTLTVTAAIVAICGNAQAKKLSYNVQFQIQDEAVAYKMGYEKLENLPLLKLELKNNAQDSRFVQMQNDPRAQIEIINQYDQLSTTISMGMPVDREGARYVEKTFPYRALSDQERPKEFSDILKADHYRLNRFQGEGWAF